MVSLKDSLTLPWAQILTIACYLKHVHDRTKCLKWCDISIHSIIWCDNARLSFCTMIWSGQKSGTWTLHDSPFNVFSCPLSVWWVFLSIRCHWRLMDAQLCSDSEYRSLILNCWQIHFSAVVQFVVVEVYWAHVRATVTERWVQCAVHRFSSHGTFFFYTVRINHLNVTPGWKLNLQAIVKNDFSAWLIRPQPAAPSVLSASECWMSCF